MQLLRDEPTGLETDAFGHEAYGEVLIEAIEHGRQPMTIGLLGPWGVGKSSVLAYMDRELRSREIAIVRFDAWRYDAATFRRHFLRETTRALAEQRALDTDAFAVEQRLSPLDVDRQETRFRSLPTLDSLRAGVFQALAALLVVFGALQIPVVRDSFVSVDVGRGALIALLAAAVTLACALARDLFRPVPTTQTHRKVEDPERFYELFRDLVVATRAKRLVIAIDNLDRCPAADALELLSMIKTYLEPAAKEAEAKERRDAAPQTDVLFVLAVDDRALRRHLGAGQGDEQQRDADEYLRKIFSATIRFAPLLRDDLRDYVSAKVEEISASLALDDADTRGLVALVASAYRDSPRQIIQFLNNLQLKLALVRERERGAHPRIRGGISKQALMVAKLALIEERWPIHYELLQQQPQLFDDWHQRAREPASVGEQSEHEWVGLAPFLRLSDAIRTADVRPFLRLKQSQDEVTLPGYEDFRAALVGSDREGVTQALDEHPELVASYAARARGLFEEELSAGNVQAARAVLDAVLVEVRLDDRETTAADLLARAAADPHFKPQLRFLPAKPLLQTASAVEDPVVRARITADVVGRLDDGARDRAREAAEAIAGNPSPLSAKDRGIVGEQLKRAPLIDDYPLLHQLVVAGVAPLPAEAAHHLATAIGNNPLLLVGPSRGPAVTWLVDAILAGEDARARVQLAESLAEVLPSFGTAENSRDASMVLDILSRWPEDELPPRSARVALRTAQFPDDGFDVGLTRLLWSWAAAAEEPEELARLTDRAIRAGSDLRVVASGFTSLSIESRTAVTERLVELAGRAEQDAAAETLVTLLRQVAPEPTAALIAVATAWFAAEWFASDATAARAARLLGYDSPASTPAATQLADEALRVASIDEKAVTALLWLGLAAHVVGPERRVQVAARLLLVNRLGGFVGGPLPSPSEVAATVDLLTALRDDALLRETLGAMVPRLSGSARFGAAVDLLIPVQALLAAGDRAQLRGDCLQAWAVDGDARPVYARRLRGLSRVADESERDTLAAQAILLSRTTPFDVDLRVELLDVVNESVGAGALLLLHLLELRDSALSDDAATFRALADKPAWRDGLRRLDEGEPLAERDYLRQLAGAGKASSSPAPDQLSTKQLERLARADFLTDDDPPQLTPPGRIVAGAEPRQA
jgi:hypothetical protein